MTNNTLSQTSWGLSLCAAMLLSITIIGCKKKTHTYITPDPAFSSYVYAFSSGEVSKNSAIMVRFMDQVVTTDRIGTEVSDGVMSFSPKLEGTVLWEDDRTIKFSPEDGLPSGKSFIASVNLNKLFDNVPSALRNFEFDFRTREQGYTVQVNGIRTVDISDLSKQEISGYIQTADVVEPEAAEQILSFTQKKNDKLTIEWTHSNDQLNHEFTIKNVARGDRASAVELSWNGSSIGVSDRGKKTVEIPAQGDFSAISAMVAQGENQHVIVTFSDPLKGTQNLEGLTLIKGYKGKLRHTINGNQLYIYPASRISGDHTIILSKAIRNTENKKMKNPGEWLLAFEQNQPEVRLVGRGVIIPESEGLIFPFEAVSLNAIDVEVFKIFSNNILQFLQNNELSGNYNLQQVGRVVYQKKISLNTLDAEANTSAWHRYALDLSQFIKRDPDALYQVRIGFKQDYASYACKDAAGKEDNNLTEMGSEELDEDDEIESIMRHRYHYYEGYRWQDRKDPCKPAYYNSDKYSSRNVIASNIGLIAKRGSNGTTYVIATDLLTAKPEGGVTLEFFDYQQQSLGTTITEGNGIAVMDNKRKPFAIIANKDGQRGYLKMEDGASLSLSRFDVGGQQVQKGLKGFIYGERGVWRPGDSIYLSFILEDKQNTLPGNHPVTFEFYDPKGQLQQKTSTARHVNQIYSFYTKTDSEAPTGNWRAKVKVGGATFSKNIKVETVKPNRLKINLDFGKEELTKEDGKLKGNLQVNWLHGAPAKDLKAKVEVEVKSINTTFEKYKEFEFDDPARRLNAEPQVVFEDETDKNGKAKISASIESKEAPGKLQASFKTRAFEKGGDFSSDNFSVNYHPYDYYTGIRVPKDRYGGTHLDMAKTHEIDFVVVDTEGKPRRNRELKVGLYRLDWSWWWERSRRNLTSYNSSSHLGSQKNEAITTNSRGEASWDVKVEKWGRYMVRACDDDGHCTGKIFYAGYPWYDEDEGSMSEESRRAASMLSFSADKEKYEVGDAINLRIPTSEEGRVLITIENGSEVIESYWVDAEKGETKYRFYANEKMTPTAYVHVTHIQPHGQGKNDLPIRMYGVIPIRVEDPKSRLEPIVDMPDVLKPEETVTVKVREKDGKPMAYTLAIVDDGLLDLTRYKTPSPWDVFFAREALGVTTWDVYDYVLGAYGGELERILSIGGDDAAAAVGAKKANRFKPVVRHIGPFYLDKNGKNSHEIKIPNYVGSVRTMVVASDRGAYGNAQKTTPVRKPLMVLATMPRVLSPTETLKLPVNVFAMEKNVRNVTVKVESNSLLTILGEDTQNLTFSSPGDEMLYFDIKVPEGIGIAKVKVTATSGSEIATQEIELDVRNPNPYVTNVQEDVVAEGKTWETDIKLAGMRGTNTGMLEISSIPPLNLSKRLRYLIRYPHGCIEQTTSSVFPQLYLSKLMDLDATRTGEIDKNIKAGLERLKKFQTGDGGFAYWPGNGESNAWGSNYAGHFMLEAQQLGYSLPPGMLSKWKKHQRSKARSWTPPAHKKGFNDHGSHNSYDLMQAYRLYVLALAGAPEMSAMNRMRESTELSAQGAWRLAAAYAAAGKPEVATKLTKSLTTEVKEYRELSYTYGSNVRDQAMILETLILMGDTEQAAKLLKVISTQLASNRWHSTQTTAYSLLAAGKFVVKLGGSTKDIRFTYNVGGQGDKNAGTSNPVMQIPISADDLANKKVTIKNTTDGILYARVITEGRPLLGDSTKAENDLKISVTYKTLKGEKISPKKIEQGTDFVAEVVITNPGLRGNYEEMALSQVFPAGWELRNSRMDNIDGYTMENSYSEYQDIRDDRVYTYFDITGKDTRTYSILLNAAYEGRYYLPTVSCEAMYDNTISARVPGYWVKVVKGGAL